MVPLALWALLAASYAAADDPCIPLPPLAGPSALDLPLCGNGLLDPGEVCDDGNRVGGDGCNAWCSAFDRLTRVCTLAGQNPYYASQAHCLTAQTAAGFSPSDAFFCHLNALGVAPDGTYALVADGGLLIRMQLFTDNVMASLSILPATSIYPFQRFCSLMVLDTELILAHECAEQSIIAFVNNDSGEFSRPFSMPLQPSSTMRSYKGSHQIVLAGAPTSSSACVQVYVFNTTSLQGALLGSIDCVAYNVVENGNIYPSFSLDGMVPYQVTMEPCPAQMNAAQCYAVYMQRSDMQILKAFMAVEGGLDVQFTVSTDERANVLGAPLVVGSQATQNTYSLTGNCFTLQNTALSPVMKKVPPMMALGNTCGLLPFTPAAASCSTPLNNPFITEIAASSYLLPQGLASSMQHQTLFSIFSPDQLPLYKQILDNTHNGTVPIDMAELPNTHDILFITQTTLGLLSTKGIVFMDIYNPGYCRATHAIFCKQGFFGSVGGVCTPCSQADTSVSAQIQCTSLALSASANRRLLSSSFQSAPYTQSTLLINTKSVTQVCAPPPHRQAHHLIATWLQALLGLLTNYYLVTKGFNCTNTYALTPPQPYNMAADYAEAQMTPPNGQLIPQLLQQAGLRDARNYSEMGGGEYLVALSTTTTELLDSLHTFNNALRPTEQQMAACGWAHNNVTDALDASPCKFLINRDFHTYWLPCALAAVLSSPAAPGARRLLQVSTSSAMLMLHTPSTFLSSTTVSYGDSVLPVPSLNGNATLSSRGLSPSSSSSGASTTAWIIFAGIVVGLVICLVLLGVLYCLVMQRLPQAAPPSNYKSA